MSSSSNCRCGGQFLRFVAPHGGSRRRRRMVRAEHVQTPASRRRARRTTADDRAHPLAIRGVPYNPERISYALKHNLGDSAAPPPTLQVQCKRAHFAYCTEIAASSCCSRHSTRNSYPAVFLSMFEPQNLMHRQETPHGTTMRVFQGVDWVQMTCDQMHEMTFIAESESIR
jgi:hypothetical protein